MLKETSSLTLLVPLRTFFLKRGYKVMMKQTVYRKGVALDNFRMSKRYADRKSVSGMVI